MQSSTLPRFHAHFPKKINIPCEQVCCLITCALINMQHVPALYCFLQFTTAQICLVASLRIDGMFVTSQWICIPHCADNHVCCATILTNSILQPLQTSLLAITY